jgi:hypothetical protein
MYWINFRQLNINFLFLYSYIKDGCLWHSERSKQNPIRSLSTSKYGFLEFGLGEIGSINLISHEVAITKVGNLISEQPQFIFKCFI